MYMNKFLFFTNKHSINLYRINIKQFTKKYKTVVKQLKNKTEEENFIKKEENEDYMIKPKYNESRRDDSGLNILSKFNDKKIKGYYSDLRNTVMNIEDSGPKRMYLWYGFHILPSIIFFKSFDNIMWMYQVFWISTSIGIVYSSYEFYSNPAEKKILDNHLRLGFLLCLFVMLLSIANKLSDDQNIKNFLSILNSFNFIFVYLLYAFKYREFYIPKWLKYSLRKFLAVMLILSVLLNTLGSSSNIIEKDNLNNNERQINNNLKFTDEQINLIHFRYLKEFSSKNNFFYFLEIIMEISNEQPNLEYVKNQLNEEKMSLDNKLKSFL